MSHEKEPLGTGRIRAGVWSWGAGAGGMEEVRGQQGGWWKGTPGWVRQGWGRWEGGTVGIRVGMDTVGMDG